MATTGSMGSERMVARRMGAQITTTVLERGPYRHDPCGRSLPRELVDRGEKVSSGMAARLDRYARGRMRVLGLPVGDALPCEITVVDGDKSTAERHYVVEYRNATGGATGLEGVWCERGWPCGDHGPCIRPIGG